MSFDLITFRALYQAFSDLPDTTILLVSEQAKCLADAQRCECSYMVWFALTAHLLAVSMGLEGGEGQSGALSSATIDKVSVSFSVAQPRDSWESWLGTTPYGQQAMAFLKRCSAGGFFVGGLPERDGFTSVYGIRGGRRGS